jgi:3D (Asp-Asp-Asp) domain-containing protein
MTAYNAVPAQTDGDPHITASGAWTNPEVVAARSQDLGAELPFGTVIKVERTAADTPRCRYRDVEHLIGYRVIADTMHSRWTHKIDILLDQTDTVTVEGREVNPARVIGVCSGVTITVVGHVDIKDMPKTQDELREMFADSALARK